MNPYLTLAVAGSIGLVGLELGCSDGSSTPVTTTARNLRVETVATALNTPWDLVWGPDNAIWMTERVGTISRVNPATGQVTRIGQLTVAQSTQTESGLLGMALHPDFATQPFVYVVHSYAAGGATRNRLVRMRYDGMSLGAPETLLDNIPGGGIHDGSRLAFGPDKLLYMTTGDAGDGTNAQNKSSLAGKILRLTPTGQPAPGNPFGTVVYSFGHRNPQGLVFQPVTGVLYETEHGPSDNDEVNRVVAGRNYGWPDVHGFCDNRDGLSGETAFCTANSVAEPLVTWTPTIAPAGADFYMSDLIPQWKGNLLFASLVGTRLVRLVLSADGTSVTSQETLYQGEFGRLRDVLVAPTGEVYLATSNRDGRGNPGPNDDRILRIRP
jgi:glucose/arabinose dehydrogenase